MFKIKVTEEFKESHQQYFDRNIILRLQNSNIKFDDDDIKSINSKSKEKYFKYDIQRSHDSFLQYCVDNVERISVGDFTVLRDIDNEINSRYPIIVKLINNKNFKFSNSHKVYNEKMYWEVLVDMFGYNVFGDCDLYTVIENIAKKHNSITELKKPIDKYTVQIEVINILKKLFPEFCNEIDDEFKDISKVNIMAMKDFRKKFIKFENEYSLTLTLENYKNIEFHGVWNAYLFVYASGLRTCPYCNRQYITPILTSNGKMRGTLDHFLPKNEYPYFSMSLYNLVPSCYNCNSSFKGSIKFNFDDINPYYKNMDDYIKFHANIHINEQIDIKVLHRDTCINDKVDKYIDTFKLDEQYNYHINQVEELILKRYMYSEEYIKDIRKNKLNRFNISEKHLREQIIGYTEEKMRINDEPLSKFRRDIVEQLGFFDDYDLYLENKLKDILA